MLRDNQTQWIFSDISPLGIFLADLAGDSIHINRKFHLGLDIPGILGIGAGFSQTDKLLFSNIPAARLPYPDTTLVQPNY